MKQVLGIRDEKTRMKVTPPLAVAPIISLSLLIHVRLLVRRMQDDDMRWTPNKGPSVKE